MKTKLFVAIDKFGAAYRQPLQVDTLVSTFFDSKSFSRFLLWKFINAVKWLAGYTVDTRVSTWENTKRKSEIFAGKFFIFTRDQALAFRSGRSGLNCSSLR